MAIIQCSEIQYVLAWVHTPDIIKLMKPGAEEAAMEYYAKSENSQGHQETVKEHLQKIAALAREYGEALGLADAAKLGAHVHDFGKYTKASQDVLKGTRTGVDHAISSACFLECCYKGSPGSCPVIQPYLPRCHRRVPPQLCPRFRVLRRGDPCVHTAPWAAFPRDKLLRAIERRVRIRSLLRRGRRAPCAFPNLRCCPRCWLFSCLGL